MHRVFFLILMSGKVRLCPDKIIYSNIALAVVVQLKMTRPYEYFNTNFEIPF